MHLLWNESIDGECLILPGKEFQIWHPEYLKDFLKRSFFGLGGTKQPDVVISIPLELSALIMAAKQMAV